MKIEALVALTLCHSGHSLQADHIEKILETQTFKADLKSYSSGNSDRYSEWLCNLHLVHATNQIKKGNYQHLKLIISTIEEADTNGNMKYRVRDYHQKLGFALNLPVIECVRNQKPEQLEELLTLLRRLSDHAFDNGYTDNRSCTSPLAYAKLVSHALNKRGELDSWGDKLEPDVKKRFKDSLLLANIPVYTTWPLKDSKHWLNKDNKEYRMDVFLWIYSNEEAIKSIYHKPMWAAGYIPGQGIREEEVDELIDSDTTILNAKKYLVLRKGRLAFGKDDYAKAIEYCDLVKSYIDEQAESQASGRDQLTYDDALVYGARSHMGLNQKDEAEKLMRDLRTEKGFPTTRKARKKLLNDLGIAK